MCLWYFALGSCECRNYFPLSFRIYVSDRFLSVCVASIVRMTALSLELTNGGVSSMFLLPTVATSAFL